MKKVKKPSKHFNVRAIPRKNITPYLFIAPGGIALASLVIYPLLYGSYISFFDTNLGNQWDFVGLDNYISILTDSTFWNSLWVTFRFTFLVVSIHFVIGIVLGLALNQKRRFIPFFRTILILPWLVPDVVAALIFRWILNPLYGILNNVLLQLDLIDRHITWLSDRHWAFFWIVFVAVWKGFPLVMINVLAALQSVPTELYEAGKVDGASGVQTLFRIVLPCIKPVLLVTLILNTVWWLRHYTIIALLTNGGPGNVTSIISVEIFQQAFQFFRYGRAAAMAVVIFFICILITKIYRGVLERED